MDKSRFLRIWEISALVSLCVCLCAAVWAQGRSSAISADLVRLHVLAVSDDAYEQALKLRVRDAVLMQIFMRMFHRNSPRAFFVRIISRRRGKIHRNINNSWKTWQNECHFLGIRGWNCGKNFN